MTNVVLYPSKNNFEEMSVLAKLVAEVFKHKQEMFNYFETNLDKADVISIFKERILQNDKFRDEAIDTIVKNINSKAFYKQAIDSVVDPDSELEACKLVYSESQTPNYIKNLLNKIKSMKGYGAIDYSVATLCAVINSANYILGKVKMLEQINCRFDAFVFSLLLISWIKSSFDEEQKKRGFVYYCIYGYDDNKQQDEIDQIDF